MKRDARLIRPFGDGEHVFRLGIKELEELEDLCDRGFVGILQQLLAKQGSVREIRHTIRLGLIGGGMAPLDALSMVSRHIDGRIMEDGLEGPMLLAVAILRAVLWGLTDEAEEMGEESPGKFPAAGKTKARPRRSPTAEPDGPESTTPDS